MVKDLKLNVDSKLKRPSISIKPEPGKFLVAAWRPAFRRFPLMKTFLKEAALQPSEMSKSGVTCINVRNHMNASHKESSLSDRENWLVCGLSIGENIDSLCVTLCNTLIFVN